MSISIDQDVHEASAHFGVDARLIQAVVNAEGNILRAVQCSIPSVKTRAEALQILCRSAVHAMSDYVKTHDPEAFITSWGQRWAPVGASNDPTGLNAHWVHNVKALWWKV